MEFRAVLFRLTGACSSSQLEQLKLAIECLGVPPRDIEGINSFNDAYESLCHHQSTASQAVALLSAIAEKLAVHVQELSALSAYTSPEELEECRQRRDFRFSEMIIRLCNEFSEDEFRTLRHLCLATFEHHINPERVSTVMKLFQMLIRARKVVWPGNVQLLAEILTKMGKESSVEHVEEYKRLLGNLGTEQGSAERPWLEAFDASLTTAVTSTDKQCDGQSIVVVTPPLSRPPRNSALVFKSIDTKQRPVATVSTDRGPDSPASKPQSAEANGQPKLFLNPNRLEGQQVETDNPKPHEDSNPRDSGIQASITDSSSYTPAYQVTSAGSGDTSINIKRGWSKSDAIGESELHHLIDDGKTFSSHQTTKNLFLKKHKIKICFLVGICSQSLFVSLSIVLLIVGIVNHAKETDMIQNSSLDTTSFVFEGDTIILGTVDTDIISKVTVQQKPMHGDSSHTSIIYTVPRGDLKKHYSKLAKNFTDFYSRNPYRTTALISDVYLLDGSTLLYTFCGANPAQNTGKGHMYIFNNHSLYTAYTSQTPGTPPQGALCSKQLYIGTYNNSQCTMLQLPITEPAYYYIVSDTPGDIYYNYSYEIRAEYLSRFDYNPKCSDLYESNSCLLDFTKITGMIYILGYAKPHEDLEPQTTHLCIVSTGVSEAAHHWVTVSIALMYVGGGLLLLFVLFAISSVIFCIIYFRRQIQS